MTPESPSSVEEEYVHHGFRFALSLANDRHEAEDLVQQACLQVIAKKGRISSRSYLLTAIRNLFYDKVRRKKLINFESLTGMESSIPAISRTQLGVKLDLEASLNRLSAEEREVIFLNCVEGYSAAEMAPMLDKPRSTILNILSRAKANLLAREGMEAPNDLRKGAAHE
ncbi:MAG: RNA polymerase sigma factor [Verrucomicrobiaceae bacterium]